VPDLNIEGKQNLDALAGTQAFGCCINGEQHVFPYMPTASAPSSTASIRGDPLNG
jgi:hypothetical protein